MRGRMRLLLLLPDHANGRLVMSARDDAISWGLSPLQADDVLARHRDEVLREAADVAESRKESHTVEAVAHVLRRMAEEKQS